MKISVATCALMITLSLFLYSCNLLFNLSGNSYSVTYDGNGATSGKIPVDTNAYEKGQKVVAAKNSGNLSKIGYLFGGWNTEPAGIGNAYEEQTFFTMGSEDITLFAEWLTCNYTVTFDSRGAQTVAYPSFKNVTSPASTVDSLPDAPVKSGYYFAGWFTAVNGGGTEFTLFTPVTRDIIVYAKWTAKPAYTVTFISGGTTYFTHTVPENELVPIPSEPTKEGYTFGGWYRDAALTAVWNFLTDTVTGNVTLYAKWSIATFTLTFDKNAPDAVGTMDNMHLEYGVTAVLSTHNFSRTGYSFAGWSINRTGKIYYSDGASFTMGSENVTLYARWLFDTATNPNLFQYEILGNEFVLIKGYTGTGSTVTIPDLIDKYPVRQIDLYAFKNNTVIESVTIPSSINSIGFPSQSASAFEGCTNLTAINVDPANTKYSSLAGVLFSYDQTILFCYPNAKSDAAYTIPPTVTYIADRALSSCIHLSAVSFPANVSSLSIGNYAFKNCTSLTTLNLSTSVKVISYRAFAGCSNLVSVSLPSSVTVISDEVFYGCTNLSSVNIPDSIETIESGAFSMCTSLTAVYIPSSVTSLSGGAFSGCTSLLFIDVSVANPSYTSVNGVLYNHSQTVLIRFPEGKPSEFFDIPSTVTELRDSAFYHCTGIGSITIPPSVKTIGGGVFYDCSGLTWISILSEVTTIPQLMFYGCSNLGSIDIPDTVTSIGQLAFWGCSSLTLITIPATVESIGSGIFEFCTDLTSVYLEPVTPPALSNEYVLCDSGVTFYVPASADDSILNAYTSDPNWSHYKNQIRER